MMDKTEKKLYDIFDVALASDLDVSLETWVRKIEKTTEKRREVIVLSLLSGVPELVEKGKRIFNLIN